MILALLLVAAQGAGPHIYVDGSGADTNPGTSSKPFKTVEAALAAVKGQASATVTISAGEYSIPHPIALDATANGLTVEGNSGTVLNFGRHISSWRALSAAESTDVDPGSLSHLLVADLPKDTPHSIDGMNLYYKGKKMKLSSYPKTGWLSLSNPTTTSLGFSDSEPKYWHDLSEVWVQGFFGNDWSDTLTQGTIDPNGQTVTLAKTPPYGIHNNSRFRFLNVLREVNQPNEYFVDYAGGKIFFYPPETPDNSAYVSGGVYKTAVTVLNANNLTFKDLDITGGSGDAFDLTNCTNIHIQNCKVYGFGAKAINFNNSLSSTVDKCTLHDLGQDGIVLNGGDKANLKHADLTATNNTISDYGQWHLCYHPGIKMEGSGNTAAHNKIFNAPHQAIWILGSETTVEYNDIDSVCLETGDSGAVYQERDFLGAGELIRYNRFTNVAPKVNIPGVNNLVFCVYLDDQWSGATIYGNIFDCEAIGINITGGHANHIENNIFLNSVFGIFADALARDPVQVKSRTDRFQELTTKLSTAATSQPTLYSKYPYLRDLGSGSENTSSLHNVISNNIYAGSGQFVRYSRNFDKTTLNMNDNVIRTSGSLMQLMNDQPTNFKPIPVDQIGPH